MLYRIQNMEEFRELNIPKDYLKNISEHGTDETLNIIGKVIAAMLRHLQVSEEEIADFTGQVKEKKMSELFENFKGYNLPEARKKAREAGREEGRKEGEEYFLIRMVCKMLRKGKAIAEILEDWEEERSIIEEIYRAAQSFAPNYDVEEVRKAMKHRAEN